MNARYVNIPLYHWSPTTRRKQINRRGLVPNCRPVQGSWKAPYICFSNSPSWAWALSGNFGHGVQSWDLWMVWSDRVPTLTQLPAHVDSIVHEYRAHARIYKRDIWLVATRTTKETTG